MELPEVSYDWAKESKEALEKGKFIRGFNWPLGLELRVLFGAFYMVWVVAVA